MLSLLYCKISLTYKTIYILSLSKEIICKAQRQGWIQEEKECDVKKVRKPYPCPEVQWKDKKAIKEVVFVQMGVSLLLCEALTQIGPAVTYQLKKNIGGSVGDPLHLFLYKYEGDQHNQWIISCGKNDRVLFCSPKLLLILTGLDIVQLS